MDGLWNSGSRLRMDYLMVLTLGLLPLTGRVLATDRPNLEISVSILLPVLFRVFGH